jgi:hypothetical protein
VHTTEHSLTGLTTIIFASSRRGHYALKLVFLNVRFLHHLPHHMKINLVYSMPPPFTSEMCHHAKRLPPDQISETFCSVYSIVNITTDSHTTVCGFQLGPLLLVRMQLHTTWPECFMKHHPCMSQTSTKYAQWNRLYAFAMKKMLRP